MGMILEDEGISVGERHRVVDGIEYTQLIFMCNNIATKETCWRTVVNGRAEPGSAPSRRPEGPSPGSEARGRP
jgi:hypothetical protein